MLVHMLNCSLILEHVEDYGKIIREDYTALEANIVVLARTY